MRITSLLAVLLAVVSTACTPVKNQADTLHTVNIDFSNDKGCTAYLIADDEIVYEFSKNGTYEITPGEYLMVYGCGPSKGMLTKIDYPSNSNTTFIMNPGLQMERTQK